MAARAVLLLGGGLLALAAAELALRWLRPDIGQRGFRDARLGWSSREYRAFDPQAGERDPGVLRALFLGDSFLAGVNVRQMEERFPMYLEERTDGAVDAEILATAGWGPDQELLAFLEKGAAWDPDVVVLAFTANNDLINLLTHEHEGHPRKPYFALRENGGLTLHDTGGAPRALPGERAEADGIGQSYLLDLLRSLAGPGGGDAPAAAADGSRVDPRYRLFRGNTVDTVLAGVMERRPALDFSPQLGVTDVSAYVHGDYPLNTYQWRLCEAVLAELRDHVRAAGAELSILLLPTPYLAGDPELIVGSGYEQRHETPDGPLLLRMDEPRDRLRGICERLGVDFFDPTSEFLRRVLEEDLMERCWPQPGGRHFSRVGHYLLAEALQEHFEARGWLPRRGAGGAGQPADGSLR